MKKSLVRMISLLIALFGMCFAVRDAGALDAPHNTNDKTWSITCSLCHYNPSSTPSWATLPTGTDNTFANNLCKSCHNSSKMASSPASYQDAMTHSSYQTGTTYGTWSQECITCHNPHYQTQATNNSSDPLNYVVTGTISALFTSPGATNTSITDSTKNFNTLAASLNLTDFSGYLLIPNTAYPNRIYRISSQTATQLTVDGAINLNYAAVGSTYAIRYSKMVKDQIMTPFGLAAVKMYGESGTVSLATGTTTAVCQVCHTQTKSYKSNGYANDPATHSGDPDQDPGGYCKKCHQHSTGFKPPVAGCNDCHGNPPTLNVLGVSGLVGTSPTNSVYLPTGATNPISVGAHVRHASTIGMSCETCHKGSRVVMPNLIDKKIRLGFEVNSSNFSGWAGTSVTTGTIAVRNALSNGYTFTATQPGTQLVSVATYSYTCSTVYCHGGGTSTLVSLAGGTDTTPNWIGGPSQAACGTCHGISKATYTSPGSHNRHVNTGLEQMGLACSDCHGTITNYTHINGNANWNLSGRAAGTYRGAASGGSGQLAPSNPYGQCGNMYCHSSVQANGGTAAPTFYDQPTWGASSVTCDSCHGQDNQGTGEPATGNHSKHLSGYTQINCAACHVNGGDGTSQHADGQIQTGISTTWGAAATYSRGTHAPQTGYGSCSSTYCHSQGNSTTTLVASNVTPTWGNLLSCSGCHNFNQAAIQYMNSQVHAAHVNDTMNRVGRNILCSECHRSTVSSGDSPITTAANHVNKLVNIQFDNNLNKNSENPLYNGAVTTVATGATKTPGLSGYACSNLYCHSIGNLSSTLPASNTLVTAGGVSFRTVLWNNTNPGIGCDGCHGDGAGKAHPTYGPGSAGTTTANSHQKHVESYSYSCDYCHISTTDDPKPAPTYVTFGGTHLNRIEDVSFKVVSGLSGTYITTTKGCSNTYCHGTGTPPIWGGSPMACGSCHGNPPATGAHIVHAGAATTYGLSTNLSTSVAYNYSCGNCHPGNAALHINGSVEINMQSTDVGATALKSLNSPTASYVGSGVNGVCRNIYCHSNGAGGSASNLLSTAASPSWGATLTGNKCGACHGNPPTYASVGSGVAGANSHYNATGFMGQEGGHLVGQHFDNIFSGTTGTLSTGATNTASHGNAGTSTTISCLTCHNTVVSATTIDTYAMNGTGSAMNCSTCHTGATPTKLQAGAIADKSLHVNGTANVAFISPMRSRAQLVNTPTPTWTRNVGYKVAGGYDSATLNAGDWNSGTKTCTTACHNSEPVTWGDPNVTCYSCHKGL